MRFTPFGLDGAWRVDLPRSSDERGWFLRTYDLDAFHDAGIDLTIAQSSAAFNHRRHTLRGLHFQSAPAEETKLVRCTRGAAFDVAVDLRPGSPTYCDWRSVTLTEDEPVALVLPPGIAHGYLTLADATELAYDISPAYDPDATTGVRWDDPAFGIDWPATPEVMSERDRSFPDFTP